MGRDAFYLGKVKRDCVSILQEFGIDWPEPLNCSRFPEAPNLCMKPTNDQNSYLGPQQLDTDHREPVTSLEDRIFSKTMTSCPHDLVNLDPTDRRGLCVFQCNREGMFDVSKKEFARFWMLLWASINLGVTAFTVLTFIIDRQRFRFPERSIFYLSACYMLFSLAPLSRAIFPYERIVCDKLPTGQTFLIVGTLDNTSCVVSFILTYYFSVASSLWWLMLTFTWYLSAARKWVPEGIDAWSSYLHLVAWALPAMLTIAVLTTHKVDANELTGLCSVGNADPWALFGFIIIPKLIFAVVGSCLIVAGFSSMCRERDSFRRRGTDTSKLEKLMVKMGIFSALYIIPAITIIICDSYHMFILMQWHPATIACKLHGGVEKGHCKRPPLPQASEIIEIKMKLFTKDLVCFEIFLQTGEVELYFLNIFMSLVIGISTGMWTVSSKTFHSWQRAICCGLCSAAPAKYSSGGGIGNSLTNSVTLAVAGAANRPLIPVANPPPVPPPHHHYMPMTISSLPPGHVTAAQNVVSATASWKQSKLM
uniref:G-protein coupled receptors family 2 profile 2 domain-containing protein n=1 Tax=Setaria digitata TaxID=48799 RepID=A0A915Q4S6_9BILA